MHREIYFARMSVTALHFISVQGCSARTVRLTVILSSKENVKLTKVRSDFKRFLLEKGQKRISRLVLLFLTNT